MRTGIIYKYTNKNNGYIYIGQTTETLKKRDNRHFTAKNNSYFDRCYKKYGKEAFTLEIIEENVPVDKLDEREKYWIKELQSMKIDGHGYNLTKGGQYGNPN